MHRGITVRPRKIIILLYSALVRLRADLMIVYNFLRRGSRGIGTDVTCGDQQQDPKEWNGAVSGEL